MSRFVLLVLTAIALASCSPSEDKTPVRSAAATQTKAQLAVGNRVTVSGVSSGAYMAVQTHVALGDLVTGVAAVAGGPYHCAQGSVTTATGRCISGDGLDVAPLIAYAYELAAAEDIASVHDLAASRVFVFHSPEDEVVSPSVSAALVTFYGAFAPDRQIRLVDDVKTAHGWPTLDTGGACDEMSDDFINACGYDTAGELLVHLYGTLEPRVADVSGTMLMDIDLSPYLNKGSRIADRGFAFVPPGCRDSGAGCRLHIVFHGCRQGAEFIGDRFANGAGLNNWAASNRIVVLYPQIARSLVNPQGCWDWWGYTGLPYDRKNGKQVAVIERIIIAFATDELFVR